MKLTEITGKIGNVLSWPEFINRLTPVMKSTGWANSKIEDNSFLFSKQGDDGGRWMVMVEPQGNGFLTFSLGSPEEILHKAELPITEVSVYEISDFAKNWMDDLDYGDEEED